jgi:hypothetical protein
MEAGVQPKSFLIGLSIEVELIRKTVRILRKFSLGPSTSAGARKDELN